MGCGMIVLTSIQFDSGVATGELGVARGELGVLLLQAIKPNIETTTQIRTNINISAPP